MNWFKKRAILRAAKKYGCDLDGDIITYKGVKYFVYIYYGVVKVADKECFKNIPWGKRRKLIGIYF